MPTTIITVPMSESKKKEDKKQEIKVLEKEINELNAKQLEAERKLSSTKKHISVQRAARERKLAVLEREIGIPRLVVVPAKRAPKEKSPEPSTRLGTRLGTTLGRCRNVGCLRPETCYGCRDNSWGVYTYDPAPNICSRRGKTGFHRSDGSFGEYWSCG